MDRTIETSAGSLCVSVGGHGPVALPWHSLFLDNHQWIRIVADLAASHTLVAGEGSGRGQDTLTGPNAMLDNYANAAARTVMDTAGISQVDWVGNAWGGHPDSAAGFLDRSSRIERRTYRMLTVNPNA